MESVNGGGSGTGEFGRSTSENSGLGRVGVDDVRSEYPDLFDELGECPDVIPRFEGSPETCDTDGFDIGGLGVEVVGFVVRAVPCVQAVLKTVSGERAHQPRYLNSRTTNIHSGDDAHDA